MKLCNINDKKNEIVDTSCLVVALKIENGSKRTLLKRIPWTNLPNGGDPIFVNHYKIKIY